MSIFNLSETFKRAKMQDVADYLNRVLPNKNSLKGSQIVEDKNSSNTAKNSLKNPKLHRCITKVGGSSIKSNLKAPKQFSKQFSKHNTKTKKPLDPRKSYRIKKVSALGKHY